ncbi:MAG: nucleoside-diphosphate sugar epimerase/dehydratase, partial [Candidatus Thiodiazotropha sp.]
ILRNRRGDFTPVAFVDDKQRRQGREIHGIPVSGTCDDIPRLCEELAIDIVMLAIPSASSKQMRRVVERCEQADVPFRSVPQLNDLISGIVQINHLRTVSIEDLLGRDPVSLDWNSIDSALSGKVILVTGAGGSIGSELCRQLATIKPARLVLLEMSEFNLYNIEMELLNAFPGIALECHLGDIIDQPLVENLFAQTRPEVVFHAAAYKHVPMLEHQLRQAVRNNILGTRVVAQAADRFKSGVFVLVSTDKAVNPANVMGACKRGAEIFCQNLNAHSDTKFITVRFGNVLGSAGSVIPLFRKQIEAGGPVTVTDPRMERYFMTIPEACQLIMQTVVLGEGGEIFVLDMGEPIKISYLAEQMIHLSGRIPGTDIQIEYIGLRPGEKLYEELFHEKEHLQKTAHEKVFLAYHRQVEWRSLLDTLDKMKQASDLHETEQLKFLLNRLVPEHAEKEQGSSSAEQATG